MAELMDSTSRSLSLPQWTSSTRTHNSLLEGNQLFLFLSPGFKVAVDQGLQFNQVFVLPFLLDVLEEQKKALGKPILLQDCALKTPSTPPSCTETKAESVCGYPWISLSGCWCRSETETHPSDSQETSREQDSHLLFPYTEFYLWLCLAASSLQVQSSAWGSGYESYLENIPAFWVQQTCLQRLLTSEVLHFPISFL